jgi:SAM-dependent methyltransferase
MNSIEIIELNTTESILDYAYWNDEQIEKSKIFNVKDFGFDGLEASKKYNTLLGSLFEIAPVNSCKEVRNVLSIASGICWIEAKWGVKQRNLEKLTCIDLSKHRIHKLAPLVFNRYLDNVKVSLLHGSIFDFNADDYYDLVILSQAFHHIDEPIRLLKLLRSKLTENGHIVIIGEPRFTFPAYIRAIARHVYKYIIQESYREVSNLFPSYQDLFPPDYRKGDVHWSAADYRLFFRKANLTVEKMFKSPGIPFQAFLLCKSE